MDLRLGKPHDLDDLPRGRPARDDAHVLCRHAERLGEGRLHRRVGLAALGDGGHPDLERVAQPTRDAVAGSPGDDLDPQLDGNSPLLVLAVVVVVVAI